MKPETVNILTLIVNFGLACITFWYVRLTQNILKTTNNTYELSRKNSVTEIHSRFQSSMRDLQLKYPPNINEDGVILEPDERRHVQLYWYLIFDEYLTCKKLSTDPELNLLWDRYYLNGVSSALRRNVFKTEIVHLLNSGATFLNMREDFLKELTKANGGISII